MSVALITKVDGVVFVGVPEMMPVIGSSDAQDGRVPLNTLKV